MIKEKHRNFMDLTVSKRKDLYIKLKNEIRKEKETKGANFLSHSVLTGKNQWLDIYFLSAKKDVFYNVTIETVKAAWHEYVDSMVLDRALKINPRYNQEIYNEKLKEFLAEDDFKIRESVSKCMDYAYGVGLHVAINVENLTVENINKFIEDFIRNGEKEYQSEEEYSFDFNHDSSFYINEIA